MVGGFTFREICEIVITLLIVIAIGYRVAVVFDWIPKDFQPTTVVSNEYRQFKYSLANESHNQGFFGKTAYYVLNSILYVEKYISDKQKNDLEEEQTVKRCGENDIFRFFMGMGEKDNSKCIGRDEFVNKVVSGNNNQPAAPVKKPSSGPITIPDAPSVNPN